MGEWMLFPAFEELLAERVNHFYFWPDRRAYVCYYSGVLANVGEDWSDIANLADIEDMVPDLWECEIPSTDDGF